MVGFTEIFGDDVEKAGTRDVADALPVDRVVLLKTAEAGKSGGTNAAAQDMLAGFELVSPEENEEERPDIPNASEPPARPLEAPSPPVQSDPAVNDARGGDFRKVFPSVEPSPTDLKRLSDVPPEKIKEVKQEIGELARSPQDAIMDSVRRNRVTGLGETHGDLNGLQDDGRALIKKFAENKVTHLAVEVNKSLQLDLDKYLAGEITLQDFKETFMGRDTDRHNDGLLKLMKEAHDAGIKVVAVDDVPKEDGKPDPNKTFFRDAAAHRDKHMAGEISDILKSDENAKVVFWVGADHLEGNGGSSERPTAGELLKKEWGDKGGVSTFISHIDTWDDQTGEKPDLLVREMKTAAAVDTSKSKELNTMDGSRSSRYDHVLFYPATHTLQQQEQKLGKDHPDLIPTLQRTAEHFVETKQFDEAIALQERAAKIAEKAFGENSAPFVSALNELGKTQESGGKRDEALGTFESAFVKAKSLLTDERGVLAPVAANLASRYLQSGDFQKAEAAATTSLNTLRENRKAYEASLRPREGLEDASAVSVAETLLDGSGRRRNPIPPDADRSERLLTQLYNLADKQEGPSFNLVDRAIKLATLLETEGDAKRAEEFFRRAVDAAGKSGNRHSERTVLEKSAGFFTRQDRHGDATPLLERRVALVDKLGASTSERVEARVHLADNLMRRGNNADAESVYRKAIEVAGNDESGRNRALTGYIKFLEQNKRSVEAEAYKKQLSR